jgi:glutathione S-transferase
MIPAFEGSSPVMPAPRLKLVGSPASPFARKARIVAAEKRIEFAWETQNPWAADTAVADLNPLGKVPVLILEDGTALYDSRVICEFLDAVSPIGKLLPTDNRERIEVRRWEALADGVLDAGVLARLENARAENERSAGWIERQTKKMERGLDALESQLGARAFCCGNNFTLADVAVGALLGWLDFRYPTLGWRADRPNLARLAAKLAERPSFAETAPA